MNPVNHVMFRTAFRSFSACVVLIASACAGDSAEPRQGDTCCDDISTGPGDASGSAESDTSDTTAPVPTDTSDTTAPVPTDTSNPVEPPCDRQGIPTMTVGAATVEGSVHDIAACTTIDGSDRTCLSVRLTNPQPSTRVTLGPVGSRCTQCAFLSEGCNNEDCSSTFQAASGEIRLGRVGGPGGHIEFTFLNVRFVEIEADASGRDVVAKPGGRQWCVEENAFAIAYDAPETSYTTVQQTTLTPRIGTRVDADELHETRCPAGDVGFGLTGTWFEYEDFPVDVIDSIDLLCANPRAVPFGSDVSRGTESLGLADELSLETDSWCPSGTLLVGAAATFMTEGSGQSLRGLAARCADIHAWVDTTVAEPPLETRPWVGPGGSNPASFVCPRGSGLVGLRTDAEIEHSFAGVYVRFHTLRGICQPLVPVTP